MSNLQTINIEFGSINWEFGHPRFEVRDLGLCRMDDFKTTVRSSRWIKLGEQAAVPACI